MEIHISHNSGKTVATATAGGHALHCSTIFQAVAWCDAICYGVQPNRCIFRKEPCGHPIADCDTCPRHPGNEVISSG